MTENTYGPAENRVKNTGETLVENRMENPAESMGIEIQNVTAGYGKKQVLQGVELAVPSGRITTLIGCNGSGKSTLLKAVLGFLPLEKGDIRIGGVSVGELSRKELARRVAYLPQGKNLPDISAGRLVLHGRFPYLNYPRRYREQDFAIAREAMERMGISELAQKQMFQLSGGMRQKVYIAMALAGEAPVIVMDEPTTYLDVGQQFQFAQMVKQLSEDGKTIILVLHDLLLAFKISDRIAAMNEGRIVKWGTPEEILESDVIHEIYGVRVETVLTENGRQYYYGGLMKGGSAGISRKI